jgi:hypothetical protein
MLSLEQIKQAIKDNGVFDRGFQYYRHDALESLEVKRHKPIVQRLILATIQ